MGKPVPTLLEKVREVLRLKHYSPKTEESYLPWIRQYLRYHKLRHPRELGGKRSRIFWLTCDTATAIHPTLLIPPLTPRPHTTGTPARSSSPQ